MMCKLCLFVGVLGILLLTCGFHQFIADVVKILNPGYALPRCVIDILQGALRSICKVLSEESYAVTAALKILNKGKVRTTS